MANNTMLYRRRMPRWQELVFQDSTENPQLVVVQELDRSKYNQIKKSWSSLLQRPGPSPTRSDITEVPELNNDILMNILPAKIRAHIFSAFPLRVIKLPEMKLMERSSVAEYIIQNKLNNLTEKVYLTMMDVLEDPSVYVDMPWDRTRFHNEGIPAFVEDTTKFAVLSHTWGRDELNHEDFLLKRNTTNSQGYRKLKEFCKIAHEQYGVEFAWADTVCINKLSSSELDESIRSMFAWYREAFICIIHLADTKTLLDLPLDRWFTRGWTLQELLASLRIKFYNKSWQPLTNLRNEKLDPKKLHKYYPNYPTYLRGSDGKYLLQLELLGNGISAATDIPIHHIYDFQPGLRSPPLPERMKWIARRTTTRPEDMSYSMMGVLGVSISVAYGEGNERAFFRLFQAVLEVDWSPSWFLWGGKPISSHIHPSRMIPSSPACYLCWDPGCDPQGPLKEEPSTVKNAPLLPQWGLRNSGKREPITLTNTGLPMRVLVVPARIVFGPNQDAKITCLFSDDTVKMADIPREVIHHDGEHQFALGILDHDFWPWGAPKQVYAILLRRYHGPYQFPPSPPPTDQQVHGKWLFGNWERWETGGIISFSLKINFHGMKADDLNGFRVSRDQVGWKMAQGEEYISYKTELLSLHL